MSALEAPVFISLKKKDLNTSNHKQINNVIISYIHF